MVQPGMVQPGMVQPGMVQPGMAQPGRMQQHMASPSGGAMVGGNMGMQPHQQHTVSPSANPFDAFGAIGASSSHALSPQLPENPGAPSSRKDLSKNPFDTFGNL